MCYFIDIGSHKKKKIIYLKKKSFPKINSSFLGELSLLIIFKFLMHDFSVFKPTIERLCDPDYINQTLISYLDFREKLWEEHNKTYAYAASYEDFMKMIEESDDIEQLKGMR